MLHGVCFIEVLRFVWGPSSQYSLDSFPHVRAYYFVVGESSPDSSRFRLFLEVEKQEEAMEAEGRPPRAEELEEGFLGSFLRKDVRQSQRQG